MHKRVDHNFPAGIVLLCVLFSNEHLWLLNDQNFLSFSRNISVQLVWEGLDVAGDTVAIQWIPRATGSSWYAHSVQLCDPVHKNYAQECLGYMQTFR